MSVSAQAREVSAAEMGREWPYAAGIIVACFGALCLIFREEVAGAYRVWMNSATYNHCFLIIPISLYMIWQRRNMLASVSPKPDFRVLLLIPLLSLAWFGASIFGVLEVRQFVAMTIAEMMFLGVLGWPVYRRLMAPLLYLYFLVPSGEFLVPALQDFTARFAVLGLELAGIPVFSDGTIIEVPVGTFAVAEACAGLRFLIAAIAFGVFYAMEIYESRIRRLIFIGLSVVVPIIANGFRAFGLIVAAEAFGSAASIEADHVTYGWVFFSMVLVALIFIGRAFSDRDWSWEEGAPRSLRALGRPDLRATALSGMLCVGLAAVGPAVGAVLDASPALVALKEAPPSLAAPWRRLAEGAADWRPRVVRADRQYSDSFTDGSIRVDRFVALYVPRGRENNLIRSDNRIADLDRWNIAARRRAVAHIGGREAPVNAAEIVSGTSRRLVWWFYVVEGTNAASVYEVKQHQVHAYLTRNGCPSAFVAVAVEMAEGRDAAGILDQYLGTMEPLGRYLCKE